MSKYNLDEMQENKLLKIEGRGVWLTFWCLFVAIVIQFCLGTTLRELAGELFAFIPLAIYITVACIKNGIWTRNAKPTTKSNAFLSFIPMALIGIVFLLRSYINSTLISKDAIRTAVIFMLAIYIGCFLLLEVASKGYVNKRNKLDNLNDKE